MKLNLDAKERRLKVEMRLLKEEKELMRELCPHGSVVDCKGSGSYCQDCGEHNP